MWDKFLAKTFGTKHEREVKRLQPLVNRVGELEARFEKLSDAELKAKTPAFRERVERGESLDAMLPEAFAVCREAAKRVLKMRHYDVQLIGGIVLHQGKIAEMKTGEGKTLVATLPCYLNALENKGVHVVTVNDYLAKRDAEWMGRLHGFLGLTTGVIAPQQSESAKKQAYAADITYGQNNEFGFDYLRDNMKFSIYEYAQRELNFAIVDEVDSILVDEARTPLIISGPGETASDKYLNINALMPRFRRDEHYTVDEKQRSVTLTEEGNSLAQQLLLEAGLLDGGNLYDPKNLETLHIFQQSLRAHSLYFRDQQYMVSPDGRVLIIDEFTGRVLPGRRWSEGLHQAIEAKERVPIQDENITLATISFQNLFRLYNKLSGMTGTADTEASEFHKIYNLDVVVIPTNKPIARADHEDLVYRSEPEKFKAVVADIEEAHKRKQPVLVGTTSVEKSDVVAQYLNQKGIPHQVLNAKQHENEAYVVAQAGRPGAVTVATNMAGRGTDIVLGGNPEMLARFEMLQQADETLRADPAAMQAAVDDAMKDYEARCAADKQVVLEAGGLHIIGTERHESRRIDNQLRGRSGRQGDPGSSRFYLSLEDDLMRIFAGDRLQSMMDRLRMEQDVPIEHRWVTRAVENAQKKVEERNFDIRKHMLEYDDVLNQQRTTVYELRRQVLTGKYRSIPSEEERKARTEPKRFVTKADPEIAKAIEKNLGDMVRFHAAELPGADADAEAVRAARAKAMESPLASLGKVNRPGLEHDIYMWFGTQLDPEPLPEKAEAVYERVSANVALSLTEQRERLFDLCDELTAQLVERNCPPKKHYEDWDVPAIKSGFEEAFGLGAPALEGESDRQEILNHLYQDAEAVLKKKIEEFGIENFLRLARNFFLQEIDKRWIEHLQSMDQLRDGIGLRGYGQRDPKKEYKREGYDMFVGMIADVKYNVIKNTFRVRKVSEEELEALEAQRRAQAEARQAQADAAARLSAGEAPRGNRAVPKRGQPGARVVTTEPIRREAPKLGRNDPCWCGSGKKYKQCHEASDRSVAASG